jgi:hypothetical protein
MTWAKIEIEFRPEDYDTNEVMAMLVDYFSGDNRLPKAVVTLKGVSPDELPNGNDIKRLAEYFWQVNDPNKLQAIKDLRQQTHMSAIDAIDAIDEAIRRNPF